MSPVLGHLDKGETHLTVTLNSVLTPLTVAYNDSKDKASPEGKEQKRMLNMSVNGD